MRVPELWAVAGPEFFGEGAFIGWCDDDESRGWVRANPEHAVLVLGPPREGKTANLAAPTVRLSDGPTVVTSTKTDILDATLESCRRRGRVWVFDPSGTDDLPCDVIALSWSPVTSGKTWDRSVLKARAMVKASAAGERTADKSHWASRATAMTAAYLRAAYLAGTGVETLAGWVLDHDLATPATILEDRGDAWARRVLIGLERTADEELDAIFSTTANVLEAYNSDGARIAASQPNFDPDAFVRSTDTVFVTAPAHLQDLTAPLVVGLLDDIRHAAYARARKTCPGAPAPRVNFVLDELANIAPIGDLPALVSEAGGQGLHIVAFFQDLSQVRARWGTEQADGFLSLFGTKVVLPNIMDPGTLDALSKALGEELVWMEQESIADGPGGKTVTKTRTQQWRPAITPGDIAGLPKGRALHLRGAEWTYVDLVPWWWQEGDR